MNLDLSVRCPEEFTVGDLCYHSGHALMETLGLTSIPDLVVEAGDAGSSFPAENEFICGTQCPLLQIGFRDIEERVRVTMYDIPREQEYVVEAPGFRTNIVVGEGGSKAGRSIRLVLGSSAAMGLARIQKSTIKDNRLFFGAGAELSPEELRRAMRRHGLFREIQEAAQQMFFRGPLSAFEPEALMALQIEEQIDKVMVDMLGMIKISHKVDQALFSKFYSLLSETLSGSKMDEERRKNLLGLLLLIHEYLIEEAKRVAEPEPLYEEAKRIIGKLKLLGLDLSGSATP